MTREEIYEHLAQVYLEKKDKVKVVQKPRFNKRRFFRGVLLFLLGLSAFYGLTAFLSKKVTNAQAVIFALNHYPIRINYNLNAPYPPVESFSLAIPAIDASKYRYINFSVRGLDEGYPGIMKVTIKNKKNEISSFLVQDVRGKWKKISIPVGEFKEITDWSNLEDVSFVLESWNVEKKKGIILIDDISFSS